MAAGARADLDCFGKAILVEVLDTVSDRAAIVKAVEALCESVEPGEEDPMLGTLLTVAARTLATEGESPRAQAIIDRWAPFLEQDEVGEACSMIDGSGDDFQALLAEEGVLDLDVYDICSDRLLEGDESEPQDGEDPGEESEIGSGWHEDEEDFSEDQNGFDESRGTGRRSPAPAEATPRHAPQ
jgi:hypothetical protein